MQGPREAAYLCTDPTCELPKPRPVVAVAAAALADVSLPRGLPAQVVCGLPKPRSKAEAAAMAIDVVPSHSGAVCRVGSEGQGGDSGGPEMPHISLSTDPALPGPRPKALAAVEVEARSILAPMALWSGEYDGDMELCRVAAISIAADTGAVGSHFLGEDVMGVVYDKVPLETARWVVTGNGRVKVTEWGNVKVKVNGRVYAQGAVVTRVTIVINFNR